MATAKTRTTWTPAMDALLRKLYATAPWPELVDRLQCSRLAVKCRAQSLGLSRPRKQHVWTPEQDQHLRDRFATESAVDMAKAWGLQPCVVYRRAQKLGLQKDPNFLSDLAKRTGLPQRGAANSFKKGNVPWIKGRKMSPAMKSKNSHTRFQKGHLPHNTKADGHVSVRRDADGREYYWIRLSLGRWKHLHRHIWEEQHGVVPRGYVITFKDGNQKNCVLENLECITMEERLARSSVYNLPPELKSTVYAKGTLKRMINQRLKKNEQAQHR